MKFHDEFDDFVVFHNLQYCRDRDNMSCRLATAHSFLICDVTWASMQRVQCTLRVPLNHIHCPEGPRNVELSGEGVGDAAMLLHPTAPHAQGDAINGNKLALV